MTINQMPWYLFSKENQNKKIAYKHAPKIVRAFKILAVLTIIGVIAAIFLSVK